MKAFNKDMKGGYNKFIKTIDNNHVFRKAYNTLDQINNYALPIISAGAIIQPQLAPAFASFGAALKGSQNIAGAFKNTKI